MRGNMPFFQMGKIKSMVKFFWIILAVLIVAGCVAQNSETLKTSGQTVTEMPESDVAASSQERQVSIVKVNMQNENIDIIIQGNQKLDYTSMKQSFPFGIAVYLLETKLADDFQTIISDNSDINDLIVTYADKEKTTVKIEILLDQDFDYEVIKNNNILKVSLSGVETDAIVETDHLPDSSLDKEKTIQKIIAQETVVIPDETAIMTNIEFNTMEDGKSDVVIQTNHPVKYDVTQGSNSKIYLNLYNTIIPDYHKRPIVTEYFKSAVASLMPLQAPGDKKTARIEIKIREQVPYRIVRGENNILMFFEPSTIEPPEFTKAQKKVVSGTQTQTLVKAENDTDSSVKSQAVTKKNISMEEEIFGTKKQYTGEKIKLDFYETDIKNVFRILRSVGKLNFAIDKDVVGKVTLTLEHPVPWDQVLDLVLKMNSLGMKEEGNVIRIATRDSLKKEDKLVQDAITARKKALEQKKSFEPLITEYIPINYSDAAVDVKPHIEQILSKERGKISVDKRTNMIIITDTQAKVDQAREIIYRLDQVTPQIMIEAKVVEVTKNFSRDLGLGLSITRTDDDDSDNVDDRDFSVALNNPVGSAASAGSFNFWRILGANYLSLNAQIAASEIKGEVKIVSSPRILTLDNKKAKIKQGLEYAYLKREETGDSSVEFKNIDLLLEVTPHVTPDKRIAMTVYLTKNDIDSITNGIPSLATNEAETELLVNNNDTIVIGGIAKTTDNQGVVGTPFLSGIPILGRLFRTDTKIDNRNELLIFITPTIVQLNQKSNDFTSENQ